MNDEEKKFLTAFHGIVAHGKKEAPHTNIFQHQQEACSQLRDLRLEVEAELATPSSLSRTSALLARLVLLDATLAPLLVTVDEEQCGHDVLLRGYSYLKWIVEHCSVEEETASKEEAVQLKEIPLVRLTDVIESDHCHATALPFWGVALHMLLLNGLALYVTKPGIDNKSITHPLDTSIAFLQRAERIYQQWDEDVRLTRSAVPENVVQLPIDESGQLDLSAVPEEQHMAYWERFNAEDTRINTLFFLAQALTSKDEMAEAFRYCHITLYLQLVLRKEISHQEWARNTLQLSSHYCNFGAFGQALHCLKAAEALMPNQNPDEETSGAVALSYGRYHKHRLLYYAQRVPKEDLQENSKKMNLSKGWLNFPIEGVSECQPVLPVTTYEEAREEFKAAMRWFNEALKFFRFDILCTAHIELHQEICKLYDGLSSFETDPNRVIALTQRQIATMEGFPAQLNFNAYPTLIRQLLYDNGCFREHLVELRIAQRQRCGSGESTAHVEKPITEKALNKLVDRAQADFHRFCDSYMMPPPDGRPAPTIANVVVDEGARVAFFRSLMRIARLHTVKVYATPKEEFEGIRQACEDYEKAVAFAGRNPFPPDAPACANEVSYARELISLLRTKQRDLYAAFSSRESP